MAASSCGAVGVPNSILWAKMVVVDARLRAGGGGGEERQARDLRHPDFLLFGLSLSFFLFLLPFRDFR